MAFFIRIYTGHDLIPKSAPPMRESGLFIGRLPPARYSLRSEALITNPRFLALSSDVVTGSRQGKRVNNNPEPGSDLIRTGKALGSQFAQHIMQNAAVPVVFELVEGVDAA